MKVSINANRCSSSPMRMYHPLAVAAKEAGKTIYHLNIGQPDLPTPPQFFDAIANFRGFDSQFHSQFFDSFIFHINATFWRYIALQCDIFAGQKRYKLRLRYDINSLRPAGHIAPLGISHPTGISQISLGIYIAESIV